MRLADWLSAETVRRAEEARGRVIEDPAAVSAALAAGGELQSRVVRRARELGRAVGLGGDIERLRTGILATAALPLLLGLLSGSAAGRLAVGAGRQVDVLLALGALLALPGAFLLLWLFLLPLAWPRRPPGVLGRVVLLALRPLASRLASGRFRTQLLAAALGLLAERGVARWSLAILSHGFWTLYFVGALGFILVAFTLSQYDLSWGTTLLAEETIVRLIHGIGYLPGLLLGVPVPDRELILASRAGVPGAAARSTWAWFLIGSTLFYGLLPRLLLLLLSLQRLAAALRELRLDPGHLAYQRLVPLLLEVDQRGAGTPAPQAVPPPLAPLPPPGARRPDAGPPILVGIELERPAAEWPPALPGIALRVLGRIDERSARDNAVQTLRGVAPPPSHLLALCSTARTPDRGTARMLRELAVAAGAPLVIVLDEASRHAARGGDVTARQGAWRRLAGALEAAIVTLDLAAPDPEALAQLRALLGQTEPAA